MNRDFVERLHIAFDHASMAEVARRLKIPHATVRNYYQGRLPASDVLIKIAAETSVSLNWLLAGQGDIYGGQTPPVGLGKFIEDKIREIIDKRLAERELGGIQDLGAADAETVFDVEAAVLRLNDPQRIMVEWFRHEGREYPDDYGVVFFRGWGSFSPEDKMDAVRDAKRVLDRSL